MGSLHILLIIDMQSKNSRRGPENEVLGAVDLLEGETIFVKRIPSPQKNVRQTNGR